MSKFIHQSFTVIFFSRQSINYTRLHSSRMRTTRLLPVSPSMHCSRGEYLVPGGVPGLGKGVPGPGGCVWSQGVYLVRRVYLVWGVYLVPGGYQLRYSPPVNRMTNMCKNITLPQTSFAGGNN